MSRSQYRERGLVLLALLLCCAAPGSAGDRVVAIGDIHGELQGLTRILGSAGLIDAQGHWSGGKATLVQTGDMLDRGADVRGVMDLLMSLQKQARKQGGRVEVLLGNHETMNLLGNYRDVGPAAYAAFADADSEKRRQAAYEELTTYRARRARASGQTLGPPSAAERTAWMANHPPGLIEYREALGPKGHYGRWLRKRPVAVKVGETAFMHAGIGPEVGAKSLKAINRKVQQEIKGFDRTRAYLLAQGLILPFFDQPEINRVVASEIEAVKAAAERGEASRPPDAERRHRQALMELVGMNEWWTYRSDGPLWFRGFARWNEDEVEAVDALLKRFGVRHFVVGHTVVEPQKQIVPRFGGKVFLIDTGMLHSHYRGRPSALEIEEGRFIGIYGDERELLHPRAE